MRRSGCGIVVSSAVPMVLWKGDDVYHAQVDLDGRGDPQGESIPRFVVACDQAFPDVVGADDTCDNDE